ncbi:MAG: hypothetical protein LC670_15000 [Flavobacteriales bacterium]|nr:hypothetical protein [Flavobacteriales bacterium]
MPKIILNRKKEWVNMSDVYTVYVNGKKKKKLPRGGKHVLKVKRGKHTLRAKMDQFGSKEITVKLKRGQTKKVVLSGFKFQEYIVPYFGITVPLFFILKNSGVITAWWALPLFLPVGLYALYHYFIKTDEYIRVDIDENTEE